MTSSFFEGAKGFNIRNMNVDNVCGDYTDLRHTTIQETETDQEFYDQSGAVGVVNGRGKLSGTINYEGAQPPTKTRKSRPPQARSQTVPASSNTEEARRRVPLPQDYSDQDSRTAHSDKSASDSTFFKNAESFDVGDMEIRNTSGDFVDRRTTQVRKHYAREKHYNQQGAIGVVNGRGVLSGTINYGPQKGRSNALKPQPSSEEEESESEESSEDDVTRGGAHYNQRGAVGVVNDRGRLSGTVNYNAAPKKQRAKERERSGRHASRVDAGGHPRAEPYGDFASVYEEPQIHVQPFSPPQSDVHGTPVSRNPFHPQYNRGPAQSPYGGPQAPQFSQERPHVYGEARSYFPFPNNQPLSPLGLGLQTPPPTPGMASHYSTPHARQSGPDTRSYVDNNPFRRMTAPASGYDRYDINGLAGQMDKMSMQSPQASYASPPLTGYRSPVEGAPQYF
ncbi:hypothetical protein FA13DRAFT_1735868 [Coprinellus micaceus]|uniref:Uncharacterized protein n=1 Tax=Coprinellus micaceus TaxID=71717 RepID=A0A4Y7T256_COPMI|nr:hypothetical protein FA13DRAFT_1735868 [Coprinellus micaceus]